jgi:hypothetical protein
VIGGLWCRLVGRKRAFVPVVSDGHYGLHECRRREACDWRDAPAHDDTAGSAPPHHPADGPAASAATGSGMSWGRPATAGRSARLSRR